MKPVRAAKSVIACRKNGRGGAKDAARMLRALLKTVWRMLKAARQAGSAPRRPPEQLEPVHQLRVFSRRSTEAVKLFQKLAPPEFVEHMLDTIRRIRKAADEARDLDVAIESLTQGSELLGEPHESGATQGLLQRLNKSREQAQEPLDALLKELNDDDFPGQIERFAQALSATAEASSPDDSVKLDKLARKGLKRSAKNFFQAGKSDLTIDLKIHEFRIRSKKLRYTMELIEPCFGGEFNSLIDQVKVLQEVSGDIHDHAVMIDVLTGFWEESGHAHERTYFEGLLLGEMRARAELWRVFEMIWSVEIAEILKSRIDEFVTA